MKSWFNGQCMRTSWVPAAAGLCLLACSSVWAQAVEYPPGGPTVKKFSDLPDWSGVWEREGAIIWDERLPPGPAQWPPYNDKTKAQIAAAAASGHGPQGRQLCQAGGMPGMMTMVFPLEVVITPREVLLLGESSLPRRIYTDGRRHPADSVPSQVGHSIGHWKGKELIVDTCCLKEGRLPGGGTHSDAMHVTERLWAPDPNTLKDDIVVEDPKTFTKSWTTVKTFARRPNWEPMEYICEENNRYNPDGSGSITAGVARTAAPATAADIGALGKYTISVDGMDRTYSYFSSSKSHSFTPQAVVFALHDNGQTTEQFAEQSGWIKVAEEKGFSVVFPEAAKKTWIPNGREDHYLSAVLDHARTHLLSRFPGDTGGGMARGGDAPAGEGPGAAAPGAAAPAGGQRARGGDGAPAGGAPRLMASETFYYLSGAGAGAAVAQEFAINHPGKIAAIATSNGAVFNGAYAKGDEPAENYFQYMRGKVAPPISKQLKKQVPVAAWLFTTGAPNAAQTKQAEYWKRADAVANSAADSTFGTFQTAVYSNHANESQQVRTTVLPASAKYDEALVSAIWGEFFAHVARWTSSPNGDLGTMLSEAEVNKTFELRTVDIEGQPRTYYVKLPSTYHGGKSLPVVISLHGGGQTAWMYLSQVKMHEVGEKAGFITVYPQGRGNLWAWIPNGPDDKFIQRIVNDVATSYGADRTRIYMQGFSIGSAMANMMGIIHPELFAAISPNNAGGTLAKDITALADEKKAKQDYRMPIMYVAGGADATATLDGKIPAQGVIRDQLDYAKAYEHISTPDKTAPFNSAYEESAEILVPGGKLVRSGIDHRYPEGRIQIYQYFSADTTPLNLLNLVWITDMSHASEPREAQLQWDYFKEWRRNADGSLTHSAAH
jgi:poly(3-hydroxybutyrate) depolymerase